jgi:hypothetical protein
MSISKVREAYEAFSNSTKSFFGTEDELVDLITAIAEYVLKNPSPTEEKAPKIPSGYISLNAFEELYPLFSRAMLYKYCRHEYMRNHSVKILGGSYEKWFVNPSMLLEALSKYTKGYQRRIEVMRRLRNEVQ